jgi:hypothetical protein
VVCNLFTCIINTIKRFEDLCVDSIAFGLNHEMHTLGGWACAPMLQVLILQILIISQNLRFCSECRNSSANYLEIV